MNRFTTAARLALTPWARRQRRLGQSRPGLSRDEFVHAIVERGGDTEAADFIWAHLEGWGLEEGFTPYPDDDFRVVFGIAEEELEVDIIVEMLTRLSLPLPSPEMLEEVGGGGTPLQVAMLVSQTRRDHLRRSH